MNLIVDIFRESWILLQDSAVYVLFGVVIGGLMKVFLNPNTVARHLGRGRVMPVLKAALLGIPLPLCSCGVLPAAASLKRQGATNGATTAFLISTPESGVDSIALSYALLDPLMTLARPLAGFISAAVAGISESLAGKTPAREGVPELLCPVDGCCDGRDCPPEIHKRHHTLAEKIKAGLVYAYGDLWADLAGLFLLGVLVAGAISALVPEEVIGGYLGGGLSSMLLMLVVGIPMYICATSSTPIAAAMILKGVSPGAALVFLLAGPATNITSLTVLLGVLGKRATAIYLVSVAVMAVAAGLALDQVYQALGLSAQATIGQAKELFPYWLRLGGAVLLLAISIKPVYASLKARLSRSGHHYDHNHEAGHKADPEAGAEKCSTGAGCGCGH